MVDAKTVDRQLNATLTVNGQLLARATGDPQAPVIKGQGGRDLTEGEFRALGAVVEMATATFRLLVDLLEPAGTLLQIALGIDS